MDHTDLPGYVASREDSPSDLPSPAATRRSPGSFSRTLSDVPSLHDLTVQTLLDRSVTSTSEEGDAPYRLGAMLRRDSSEELTEESPDESTDESTDEAVEAFVAEYLRVEDARARIQAFIIEVTLHCEMLGQWFYQTENYLALDDVRRNLLSCDNSILSMGNIHVYSVGTYHLNSLTVILHELILSIDRHIRVDLYLMRRGPTLLERARGIVWRIGTSVTTLMHPNQEGIYYFDPIAFRLRE
jgi:hypothetical protein